MFYCGACGGEVVCGEPEEALLCSCCGLPWLSEKEPSIIEGTNLSCLDIASLKFLAKKLATGVLSGKHVNYNVLNREIALRAFGG